MGFLLDLPLELLYQIAEYLDFERDINALVRTNKRLYSSLNGYLYRHNVKQWNAAAFASVCKSGFSNSVRMFLNEGVSLGAPDRIWHSISPAAALGHEDIVKCLLEKGVDPNAKEVQVGALVKHLPGSKGFRKVGGPFELAIKHGHEGIVRLLAPYMKDVRDSELHGETPLKLAVRNGHLNLVKILVEELQCSVEPTRHQEAGGVIRNDTSPLSHAAYCGHTDIVRYLLSVEADPNGTTETRRWTAFGYAVEANHFETAKTLIEHLSNPDLFIRIQGAKDIFSDGEEDPSPYVAVHREIVCPLANAAMHGNREMVELMLQYIDLEQVLKADVEDANFLVPVAAACGLESMVQRLLEEGCDVDARIYSGRPYKLQTGTNGLSFASKFGHIGVARILFSYGADPNAPGIGWPRKPLVAAVNAGHQQMVELLLDAGANPNTMCSSTPPHEYNPVLTLAAKSEPMFRMLLDRGAELSTLKPPMKERLLQDVLRSQKVSVLKTLLEKRGISTFKIGGSFKYIMEMAAGAGTAMFQCAMQYLWADHCMKPSPQRKYSYSALESAIRHGQAEVVEILLSRYKLKLGSQNLADYLSWAASGTDRTRAEKVLDVLQRHGADINARRTDGQTCLSLLTSRNELQGARLVVERGAEYPLTYGDFGECLLSVATRNAYLDLLELLLGLIEAQVISLEAIEPHVERAEANIPGDCDKLMRLRLGRSLQSFRWRRRYPVPET